jgi:DMSO reductase family type II enzyme heme b subunit
MTPGPRPLVLVVVAALAIATPAAGDPAVPGGAWETFQRSCRPCHGMLGAGDGPYARAFARPAPTLLTPAPADVRYRWIADGVGPAGSGSAMPAFRGRLDEPRIRGLVRLLEELARGDSADGVATFAARCAACHGKDGRGDGPLAPVLIPRPRDLTRGWYRFRSTPSGGPPLAQDLLQTFERGLGTTAMGSFAALGRPRLETLAAHVLRLAGSPQAAATAVPVPDDAPTGDRERGRTLYDDTRCWQCHGEEGRGDGPTARELRDDAGHASLPANLTKRWQMKGGASVAELARAIQNGLNGTPMPSYGDALSPEEVGVLAAYVHDLGKDRPPAVTEARASRVDGALPHEPDDPRWQGVPAVVVPLGPQLFAAPEWSRPAIDAVELRIAVSNGGVAVHLTWDDRFEDRSAEDAGQATDAAVDDAARAGRWRLPDRVALQLAAPGAEGPLPSLYLGATERPVERWVWSADQPTVKVEEHRGPGRLRARPAGPSARAHFAAGRWQVVLSAVAKPEARGALAPGSPAAIAIHAWDGSQGEQGSRQALSSWITVTWPDG